MTPFVFSERTFIVTLKEPGSCSVFGIITGSSIATLYQNKRTLEQGLRLVRYTSATRYAIFKDFLIVAYKLEKLGFIFSNRSVYIIDPEGVSP
jgi:hypothetical protein